MEQPQGQTISCSEILEGYLRFVNFPVAGEEARILVAVGIPEHQLLQGLSLTPNPGEQIAIQGGLEQLFHDLWSSLQILHGFEEWNHQQVCMACGWFH